MMTEAEFAAQALALAKEAGVAETHHGYFSLQAPRLYKSCQLFNFFDGPLGDVLEIGPFYGYTPFLLRPNASNFVVLEGDDPAVYPLKPLYQKHRVDARFVDLFEMFGPTLTATHKLDLPDASFNTIICWETLEHFGFNPVKFVRELWRVLKPGGRVSITVPNRASFQSLAALILGRSEEKLIDAYWEFEDYECNGKKAFYGFHWREYTRGELRHLFARAGFTIHACDTFVAFQEHGHTSALRNVVRSANKVAASILPRFGTHVWLDARKPK